ncbi:MAG: hypothetical protein ACLQOO_29375 [Terriglobia bacterium]
MKDLAEASRARFRKLAVVEFDSREFLPACANPDEVDHLLEAADVVDDIFWRQLSPNGDTGSRLAMAGEDPELKEMIQFHYGPYDRLDNDSPFLLVPAKCRGGGFYPPDLTPEEFSGFLENHPECRASFESPYTVIRRAKGSQLTAVPYHEAFREQVQRLTAFLCEASGSEQHPPFQAFLNQRAKDLLTDDYYASDTLWVRLADNPLDLVIGPYEVYEDQLIGLKAAYEAMLLARDFAESSTIGHFQRELPSLCRDLEPRLGRRLGVESSRVALAVANLVYAGGDARKAIPAIAFSLPNDERIIEEVGSRQVILRNVLEAKFRLVDWQLHRRVLEKPLQDEDMAFRCFFDHTLFHEISHSIGPHRITVKGESTTVNRALKQHYSVLEETKADTLAACFMLSQSNDSGARAFMGTYVAGFLRAIRFGLSDAHGGANAIQFNFLSQAGALATDPRSGKILVDQMKATQSLLELAAILVDVQERGDFEAAGRLVAKFCQSTSEISRLIDRVGDLPIDIRIRFKDNLSRRGSADSSQFCDHGRVASLSLNSAEKRT